MKTGIESDAQKIALDMPCSFLLLSELDLHDMRMQGELVVGEAVELRKLVRQAPALFMHVPYATAMALPCWLREHRLSTALMCTGRESALRRSLFSRRQVGALQKTNRAASVWNQRCDRNA